MPVAPGLTIESPGEPLLDIRGLATEFLTEAGSIRAVDGVDLRVESGQTVALVGESGSGKSASPAARSGSAAATASSGIWRRWKKAPCPPSAAMRSP